MKRVFNFFRFGYYASLMKNNPVRTGMIITVILVGAAAFSIWFPSDRSTLDRQTPTGGLAVENSADRNPDSGHSFRKTEETISNEKYDLPAGKGGKAPALPENTENRFDSPDSSKTEAPETPIEDIIASFEERVLGHTGATRVRVETQFRPDADVAANRKLPGYVAFTASAESYHPDGLARTMEDIALEYFAQFPEAPRVRVSLVVGGRVRGGRTFRPEDVY